MSTPDDDVLIFRGSLNLDDTLNLHHYRDLCLMRPGFRFAIYLFAIGVGIPAFLSFFYAGFNLPGLFLVFVSICIVGNRPINRFFLVRRFMKRPDQFTETTVEISRQKIHITNTNMDLWLPWHQISAICNTSKGILILIHASSPLCWLPQRLFQDTDYKERILQYATAASTPIKIYS